jgi:hypothetical protein
MLTSMKSIFNYSIEAKDGLIGRIKDIYFDDETWFVKFFVVETQSFFRSNKVLITAAQAKRVNHLQKTVTVDLTISNIQQAPYAFSQKPVSVQAKEKIKAYYKKSRTQNLQPDNLHSATLSPIRLNQPHLRSMREVTGYQVRSFSGPAGHLFDFLAYEEGWNIRYLIVGEGGLFNNSRVLIPPQMAQRILWEGKRIEIEATSDQLGRCKISTDANDDVIANRKPRTSRWERMII